jgi:hypothetical protein
MREFRDTLVATMTLAVMGCSGGGNRMAETAPETLVGEIQLTGSAPAISVTLVTAGGRAANLVGELRAELQNLSGVEVAVRGRPTGSQREFEVDSYEIRSVGGQRPLVGMLVERDGDLWLEGEESVRLVNVPSRLRSQIGAKLWVVGRRMEGGVYPQTYGVIRSAGR